LLSELATVKAARWGSKKIIWKAPGGSESEVFNLSIDPKEKRSVKTRAEWMGPLENALGDLLFGASETQADVVETQNPEIERRMDERLKLLGYVGSEEAEP
jgi:hypothetical protein